MRLLIPLLVLFIGLTATGFGQTSWYPIESNTEQDLRCIDFLDNTIGYAAGNQVLLKTTNGGATWVEVAVDTIITLNNESWTISDIQFFTELHGRLVLGEWQGMVETFDGGITWSTFTPASDGFCRFGSIYYFDADHGLAGGAGCFESAIIDRFDNGTWATTNHPSATNWDGTDDLVRNFDFFNLDTGLACTDGARILRTSNGGLNWDSIPLPSSELPFTDIAYLSTDTVYASFAQFGGFGTYISIDGGLTWDTDWETATFYYPLMNAVHVNGNGTVFFGGLNGNDQITGVIFDNPEGLWNYQSIGHPIQDIDSHSDSITFLVGDSGSIFVNVDPSALSVDELNPAIILSAHPNPTRDWIHISVNARRLDVLDVRLFDLQGKELDIDWVSTDYGIPIRLDSIPSGQYLIEVRTDKGRNVVRFQKE